MDGFAVKSMFGLSRGGRRSWLFTIVFVALLLATIRMSARNPFLPGQDFHYHTMSAALAAQGWTTHAFPSSLYHRVSPLDPNTLLYMLVAPFELVASPLRAFSFGVTLYYFAGFPLACLGALRLLRRSPWGALLAFPCSYVKSFLGFGYMPFVSAAPLFVLGLAVMHRILARDASPRAERRTMALATVIFAATFLAHAHVYAWLMLVGAIMTLATISYRSLPELPRSPELALREALGTGIRALVVVLPSLILAVAWTFRVRGGESTPYTPSTDTYQGKLESIFPHILAQTRGDTEYVYIGAFFLVVLLAFVLAQRAKDFPSPEIAFVLALASYLILPWHVNQQSLAPRQLDIAIWTLPLVVYPAAAVARVRARHALVVAALATFAAMRLNHIDTNLRKFQGEMAGLLALTKSCPPGPAELAYVTSEMESAHMTGLGLHQAHETFAALCRLDTPVYDTTKPAYRVAPLRYKGALPAPITILVRRPNWYASGAIWRNFEYVLLYKWRATHAMIEEASRSADRIGASGDWELWRRKPVHGG